jgi:hypothetical protein
MPSLLKVNIPSILSLNSLLSLNRCRYWLHRLEVQLSWQESFIERKEVFPDVFVRPHIPDDLVFIADFHFPNDFEDYCQLDLFTPNFCLNCQSWLYRNPR